MGGIPPATNDGTQSAWNALAVDVNTPIVEPPTVISSEFFYWHQTQNGVNTNAPYPDYHLAYHTVRWNPIKVRAMRKFECDPIIGNPILGCTNPLANNYDPLANVDDGSCVFPPSPPAPCFSVCAIEENGSWGPGWNWTGPIAMENNPIGYSTLPWSYPLPPQDFTAFYDWILNSIPTLTPGDTFILSGWPSSCSAPNWDCFTYSYQQWVIGYGSLPSYWTTVYTTTSWSSICLKYEGMQSYSSFNPLSAPMHITNSQYPVPTITPSSCCVSSPITGGSSARVGNFEDKGDYYRDVIVSGIGQQLPKEIK